MIKILNSAEVKKITVEEFKQFTLTHQRRVLCLGRHLFQEYKKQFHSVNFDLVHEFLALHDQAKTAVNTDGTEQIELLYQFFGINKSELPENEKFKILSMINHINYVDAQKALQFFTLHNLIKDNGELAAAAQSLLLIEKISDLVDRGLCQIATIEFNRKLQPASEIVEAHQAHYAKFLEENYLYITAALNEPLKKID